MKHSYNEIRAVRIKKMRMFNEMLNIARKQFGDAYGMVITDHLKISLNRAEGLDFSETQFKQLARLLKEPSDKIAYGYAG